MNAKRIIAAILTFGLSEIMGYTTHPDDCVIMTNDSELKLAMRDNKIEFTKL